MIRALLISVRLHDDRYHGSGDWPPSPARLFQALVAAAARPALDQTSREALIWLEKLDAPTIAAPTTRSGQHVSLFVPNNDLDAKGGDIRRIAEIRSATKHIRPRLFNASVPLLYVWLFDDVDEGETLARRMCEIAERLYQLGRGVDMAWAVGEVLDEADVDAHLSGYRGVIYRPSSGGKGATLNCPDDGSLVSLEIRYKAGAKRFRHIEGGGKVRTEFSNAPKPLFRSVAYNSPSTRLLFDLRRTMAPGSPFAPWPLKKISALVQKLRGSDGNDRQPESGASARLAQHFDRGTVSRILIGRDAKETDKALRIRILPLPSIGHSQVDRSIRRVLVEVPPDCPIRAADVAWAFSGLEIEPPVLDTETGEILFSSVGLVSASDNSMLEHYGIGADISSCVWRSVTPLALPPSAARRRIEPTKRHEQAKAGRERQSENQKACHEALQAVRHAGIFHRVSELRAQREPFDAKGARAEAFSLGTRFAKDRLWHVEVTFSKPIQGPMVIGDGRYAGLGLMRPVDTNIDAYNFHIVDGLETSVDPIACARALRRAVMSRVQVVIGRRELLPSFFTGHEDDGSPLRRGGHSHLAFVSDLPRQRLLIIAPHALEHRQPGSERKNNKSLAAAVSEFELLRAGCAGLLRLSAADLDFDEDPLFGFSLKWESVTDYQLTRYVKRVSPKQALITDVESEIRRLGIPVPQVEILKLNEGLKGGLSGRLRLTFPIGVRGPLLLGKTRHVGGGLFERKGPIPADN